MPSKDLLTWSFWVIRLLTSYKGEFDIQKHEIQRAVQKAFHLSLLYSDLFSEQFSWKEVYVLSQAGVASTLYDISSDWWKSLSIYRWKLLFALRELGWEEAAKIGIDLFDKDIEGKLENDGLERGVTTLEYIIASGWTDFLNQMNSSTVHTLGFFLQIVDDILDYEEDIKTDDTNCFRSCNADNYVSYYRDYLQKYSWLAERPIFGWKLLPIVEARLKKINH